MQTVFYCTIHHDHTATHNDIHKKITAIYQQSPGPRWCSNGSVVEVVSDKMPIRCGQVSSVREVSVPTGSLTLSFQYPAIRRINDGKKEHVKIYDSPAIAKKQISEKVCVRLSELGMSDVRIVEYVHNVCRLDLHDRKNGISKVPVSFIVAKCVCADEDKVRHLMVNGIGKFRFAGLGMIYVTEG